MYKVIVKRYGEELLFEKETLNKAVSFCLSSLDNDLAFPVKIEDENGGIVWSWGAESISSLEDSLRKLYKDKVQIEFIDAKERLPEYIPMIDDYRNFLFTDEQGKTYSGFYIGDGVFIDGNRNTYLNIVAWIEWEDASE